MRKLTEILRLKHEARLSHAKIEAALGLAKGVISKYVSLAEAKGLAALSGSHFESPRLCRGMVTCELLAQPIDIVRVYSLDSH